MGAVPCVLEVTAQTVRATGGSGRRPPRTLVEAALDWIDDPVGLFDERPVAVADLWRSLVATLLGPRCDSVVVVHPVDWSRARVDRLVAAANTVADRIEAVTADRWDGLGGTTPEGGADTQRERCVAARGRRRVVGLLVVAGVSLVSGAVVVGWPRTVGPGAAGTTLLDGRMAVRVPAPWTVQRVTGGPGSRRLQATSPVDPGIAVHLTSSYVPATTLADAAQVLRRAIAGEPPGVFADLRAEATVAGRAAVTYRESRPGRVITWIVVLDGSTRISIGCQSPPGRESDIRAACDDAVRSAHEI